MRKPDFFIIGQPKCGTTAMSEYLREHPDIFFSDPKEPNFFCRDLFSFHGSALENEKSYLEHCFGKASEKHLAVGEGSPFYLCSSVAAEEIKKFQPGARLIVMLRNPVEMAQSLHSQLLFSLIEDLDDFVDAWQAQQERKQGRRIPELCTEPALLQYRFICSHSIHLERLFRHFDRDSVHIVFFNDFKSDTPGAYRGVLDFLGLAYDGRTSFPVINPNKTHFFRGAGVAYEKLTRAVDRPKRTVKRLLGVRSFGIGRLVHSINRRPVERKSLPDDFRRSLHDEFLPDIERLEQLLSVDLSGWKNP